MQQSALPASDTHDAVAAVVDCFLDAVLAATISTCEVWAPDATLDVTVPDWRFHRRGVDAVRETYGAWFSEPGRFEELRREPTRDGEVVRYLVASTEKGVPYTAHHVHWLEVRDGKIRSDVVFCGGRWSAARQAEMEAADA
jgi:ketosteroid isomerase-like protein